MLFGRFKDGSYGFSPFSNRFESFKEIDADEHMSLVSRANKEGKIIGADEAGFPVLLDPPPPTEEEVKNSRISELENYLRETDWYAIRFADTGEEIPADIKKKRQDARDEISRLREK